jgi:hypothetical protein
MRKRIISIVLIAIFVFLFQIFGSATNGSNVFDKLKFANSDIPEGFMYGEVPDYAKKTIKDNPCELDQSAIRKLADQIYPGGDYSKISGIFVSILAKIGTPHGDDIVCYIIIFKDPSAAREEIKKITDFAGYNQDRVIIEIKNSLAVYLLVDDVKDYPLIKVMSEKIKERLKSL